MKTYKLLAQPHQNSLQSTQLSNCLQIMSVVRTRLQVLHELSIISSQDINIKGIRDILSNVL
ncbi:CLUMA_CG014652, isoform A [Clunio marinus]|uniref:CLUMA_CG014652, isoform A n=1 Tax=Clunio marinus TaxID=568069 RepID=A0A1J1IQ58_9DIPT|nr:CLUMA_CG014652, isoform A [Clunio marinus]